jgi:hypothetical protein
MKLNYALLFAAALFAGCAGNDKKENTTAALDTGMALDIKQHIAVLANDSLNRP